MSVAVWGAKWWGETFQVPCRSRLVEYEHYQDNTENETAKGGKKWSKNLKHYKKLVQMGGKKEHK